MHKSGHTRLTNNLSLDSREQGNDIGLFTFYRNQQEEEQNVHQIIIKKQKLKDRKNIKKVVHFFQRKHCTAQTHTNTSQNAQNDQKRCEVFLKNITTRSWKKNIPEQRAYKGDQIQNKTTPDQNNVESSENSTEKQTVAKREYPKLSNLPCSEITLRSIAEILDDKKHSPAKVPKDADCKMVSFNLRKKQSYTKTKIMSFNKDEDTNKEVKYKYGKMKSSQRSQIPKDRRSQGDHQIQPTTEKQHRINKFEHLNQRNQKYFSDLIQNVYISKHAENQAGKMLKQSLQFPNVSCKQHLKTQGNQYSPSKYQPFTLTKTDFTSLSKIPSNRQKKPFLTTTSKQSKQHHNLTSNKPNMLFKMSQIFKK